MTALRRDDGVKTLSVAEFQVTFSSPVMDPEKLGCPIIGKQPGFVSLQKCHQRRPGLPRPFSFMGRINKS